MSSLRVSSIQPLCSGGVLCPPLATLAADVCSLTSCVRTQRTTAATTPCLGSGRCCCREGQRIVSTGRIYWGNFQKCCSVLDSFNDNLQDEINLSRFRRSHWVVELKQNPVNSVEIENWDRNYLLDKSTRCPETLTWTPSESSSMSWRPATSNPTLSPLLDFQVTTTT